MMPLAIAIAATAVAQTRWEVHRPPLAQPKVASPAATQPPPVLEQKPAPAPAANPAAGLPVATQPVPAVHPRTAELIATLPAHTSTPKPAPPSAKPLPPPSHAPVPPRVAPPLVAARPRQTQLIAALAVYPANPWPAPAPSPRPERLTSVEPAFPLDEAAASAGFDQDAELVAIRLINEERARRGLSQLELDPQLSRAAREHCRRMAADRSVEHQYAGEPDLVRRANATGVLFDHVSENLALDSEGVHAAHEALMHSLHHRENILAPDFTAVGVGALWSGNILYVTEDFIHRAPGVSAAEAENTVARIFNEQRHQAGSSTLPRIYRQELRDMACGMADANRLNAEQAHALPGVADVAAFTVRNFDQLPPGVYRLRTAPATGFSVAACGSPSAGNGDGVYWVVLVTYY